MLRLPAFEVAVPETIEAAVAALATPGARVIAGGTDLLPNLKHRLYATGLLVSLDKVAALRGIAVDDSAGILRIGAGVTLSEIAASELVSARFPSLARAAGLVASPLIRNMGTIGGNLNLDTRCRYVNQTHFWRSAISGCLKSEGSVCHVVPGGQSCVAAMSSDCAPVLISLQAQIVNVGPSGPRAIELLDYYNTDGVRHINIRPQEITTEVRIPLPRRPQRARYAKWTVRKSIDFPLVSVAMRFELERDSDDAAIAAARICVGVLAAKPKLIKRTETLVGRRYSDPATADAVGQLIHAQSKPLDNVPYEADYRRKMLPVFARRALR